MLPALDYPHRRTLAQALMIAAGIDALVVPISTDLQFLAGFQIKKTERPLLLVLKARSGPLLICPAFEQDRVQALVDDLSFALYAEEESPYEVAAFHLSQTHRVAVSDYAYYAEFRGLVNALPHVEFTTAEGIIAPLRWRKGPPEVERIRQSAADWQAALARLTKEWKRGTQASQIRQRMLAEVVRGGGVEPSCTVSIGPSSALPHGGQDAPVEAGQVLLIDGGVSRDGYRSDITRTFTFGAMSPRVREVMQLVLDAQTAAIEAVRPGVPAEAIDAAARSLISRAGYGKAFTHRVGHGLGISGHEPPYLVAGNRQPLESGMVITIEPGVYLPGQFGVRLEDDILVTDSGAECLSVRVSNIDELALEID